MKTKITAIASVVSLVFVLFSCSGECKESKDYKDLQAKLAKYEAQDSIDEAQIKAYNEVTDLFMKNKNAELEKYVAADLIDHNPDTMMTKKTGLEGMIEMGNMLHEAYSDMTFKPTMVISKGDKVYAFGKMGGKNTGPIMPGMKPTNKTFEVDFYEVVRFENGKQKERWGLFDSYTFMTQMGMMNH